ncbi:Longin-like domain-containing protein [Thamnocephalis sphaerospora]|uniref:Synaptobrevin homolog YKT6 n=1 Tax=Thamnocephalis sphaerospora TaxID=78915 RepID=A0A4P9XRH4_9FUNG|nr:Longin-like domain-containing protein [Thamnocephalis sphaerospora]|eukprot:RKP08683.1 Longin-like domain-containing protein [Thamnocephalis sphaerospora]
MSIIYGLVARGPTILAEHTASTGNFTTVTQHILEKIPAEDSKLTYVYDRYLFHYVCQDGIVYLCMADDSFGRRIPFAFLEDLKTRFTALYTPDQVASAIAYGMNEFSRTVAERMDFYSNNPSADRFRQVHGELEQVKGVMVQNIERVLERGERIDLLVDRTDQLSQAAFTFRKRTTALKRAMWWKNIKLMFMLVMVLIVSAAVARRQKDASR